MPPFSWRLVFLVLLVTNLLVRCTASSTTSDGKTKHDDASVTTTTTSSSSSLPPDYLTRDSVVLITGAAGFIGSELAMALYRTYRPRKIICIDSMESEFGGITPDNILDQSTTTSTEHQQRTERDLALLEFKRQRVFHLLQTLGTTAHFYRVDLRPNIPEFFEAGEVPILHHIFNMHKDITHVVHLADHYHRGMLQEKSTSQLLFQAVPRLKDQAKAGMIEAILEELRLIKTERKRAPHFVYASSYEVYNYRQPNENTVNPPPFSEDKPVSTPSSLTGASKLMDEVLVQAYYETDALYSVGLRLFSVYGPWGLPGSPLFEMAERTVLGQSPLDIDSDIMDDVRDYIYIDDAIDAIMTAMQFRTQENVPVIFNVGSGKGTTLRTMANAMQAAFSDAATQDAASSSPETVAIASTKRSEALLGFRARVSIKDGIEQLLAWHYDRAFPYGVGPDRDNNRIAEKGMVSCQRYDTECLKGAPVFPCASECANPNQCMSSFFDDVFVVTRQLTEECSDVLYTVALDENLAAIPSAQVAISSSSISRVENVGSSKCNIAFVSDSSPLVRRLFSSRSSDALVHGHWTLVPVTLSKQNTDHAPYLALIPKLSPGLFFRSSKTKRAIYTDPTVVFDSIPNLLAEFEKVPQPATSLDTPAATAMLIGKRSDVTEGADHSILRDHLHSKRAITQESAYRMIRIAAINEMLTEAFTQHVDTSFIVHALVNDARLFRCDVLAELVQWDVNDDRTAFEFIMGLHDMWSRVISKKRGEQPWWIMGNVEEKQRGEKQSDSKEKASDTVKSKKTKKKTSIKDHAKGEKEEVDTTTGASAAKKQEVKDVNNDETENGEKSGEGESLKKTQARSAAGAVKENVDQEPRDPKEKVVIPQVGAEERRRRRLLAEEDDEGDEKDAEDGPLISGWGEEHNNFGMPESIQDAVRAVFGDAKIRLPRKNGEDDIAEDDDDGLSDENGEHGANLVTTKEGIEKDTVQAWQDPDSNDVWLGVLSSTQVQYFARIVPSTTVGAVHLDAYPRRQ